VGVAQFLPLFDASGTLIGFETSSDRRSFFAAEFGGIGLNPGAVPYVPGGVAGVNFAALPSQPPGAGGLWNNNGVITYTPLVLPAQAWQLPKILANYGSVVLQDNGNYQTNGPPSITMQSGWQIYGNALLPPIYFPNGLITDVVIDGIAGSSGTYGWDIIFSPGCLAWNIKIVGCSVVGELYYGLPGILVSAGAYVDLCNFVEIGALTVACSVSGAVTRSTVRRFLGRGGASYVSWTGNSTTPCYGNAFCCLLSINTAIAQPSTFTNAGDLWLFIPNSETWLGSGTLVPGMTIIGSTRVYFAGEGGGTNAGNDGPIVSVANATSLVSYENNGNGLPGNADGDWLLSNVVTYARMQGQAGTIYTDTNLPATNYRLTVCDPTPIGTGNFINGANVTGGLNALQQAALMNALIPPVVDTNGPAKPILRTLFDPLAAQGAGWNAYAATQPDSGPALQALLNAAAAYALAHSVNNPVPLPGGLYFLKSGALTISGSTGYQQGFISSDGNQIYLIQTNPAADVIDYIAPNTSVDINIKMTRVTFYGGRYGMYTDNVLGGSIIAASVFRYVQFFKQSVAAFGWINAQAIDSNFWCHCDFAWMPSVYVATTNGPLNYADKQFWYDCQFQFIANDVWGWQVNRACNNAYFSTCYFYQVGQVTNVGGALNTMHENCVFDTVTGARGFNTTNGYNVSAIELDCIWQGPGPTAVAGSLGDGGAYMHFDTQFNQTGGTIQAADGVGHVMGHGCVIGGTATLGTVNYGMLVNCNLGAAANDEIDFYYAGTKTVGVAGPAPALRTILYA
jgi:hypothetical protein